MSISVASVNSECISKPPAARKPSFKKTFRRPEETDAGWAIRTEAERLSRRGKVAARKEKQRSASKALALRVAPALAERVASAKARLEVRFAEAVAANPKITSTVWSWIQYKASTTTDTDARIVVAADAAPLHADRRKAKAALVRADVALRLRRGYEWAGGSVAGNGEYVRDAFKYEGLVSDEHPIFAHFVSKLPRARNLRIADDKAQTYSMPSKLLAADAAYVEANKSMVGVVRIEIDVNLALPEIRLACDNAGVPRPNIVVGWQDAQGTFVRPHLLWLLHDSVPVVGPQNKRFLSLYRGVCRGLTKALLPVGADVGGLANVHRHKNPLSPLWDRAVLVEQPYELEDIRKNVDVTVRMKTLHEMATAPRGADVPSATLDHPVPEVAGQSNKLFAHLSAWAKLAVVAHRAAGGERPEFDAMVAGESHRTAAALSGDAARAEVSARRCAATVAQWTWCEYVPPKPKAAKLTGQALTDKLAAGGRLACEQRKSRSEGILVAAALRLSESGEVPTRAEVLAAVVDAGVKSERTIRRHWAAVQQALACQHSFRTSAGVSVKENNFTSVTDKRNQEVNPVSMQSTSTHEVILNEESTTTEIKPPSEIIVPASANRVVVRRPDLPSFLGSAYRPHEFLALVSVTVVDEALPDNSYDAPW